MNRNDLDEELEEKVVTEGRRRWHRLHAGIFNLLNGLDAPIEDVDVDGKVYILLDDRNRWWRHRFVTIKKRLMREVIDEQRSVFEKNSIFGELF